MIHRIRLATSHRPRPDRVPSADMPAYPPRHPVNADPCYVVDGVVHYGVANMPGAVPRTSTYALTNATLPFARRLARLGPVDAIKKDTQLRSAVNAWKGKITHRGVAEAFGLPFTDALSLA